MISKTDPLLTLIDLQVSFRTTSGSIPAVDGISLRIHPGETLGLVGESGCGKTLTSLSIMGLLPKPNAFVSKGSVVFEHQYLAQLSDSEMRRIRGNHISMVFQEPMTSLNPVYTIGNQMVDVLELHQGLRGREAATAAIDMLKVVGIPSPEQRIKQYPHNLSGGMRQRVMIAIALACKPKLLIADEPTTALDVTIQAQILEVLKRLRADLGMSMLLITHALGVVAEMADRVAVMYAGQIVEEAQVRELFHHLAHPYTQGLLASIPRIDHGKTPLHVISGTVPAIGNIPSGCRFHPRCPLAVTECAEREAVLADVSPDHQVRCWRVMEKGGRQA